MHLLTERYMYLSTTESRRTMNKRSDRLYNIITLSAQQIMLYRCRENGVSRFASLAAALKSNRIVILSIIENK